MMHLDHLNLCASDAPALSSTLEQHFGYGLVQAGRVPDVAGLANAGSEFAFLLGEDGSSIVVSQIDAQPDGRSSLSSAVPPRAHAGVRGRRARQARRARRCRVRARQLPPPPAAAGAAQLPRRCFGGDYDCCHHSTARESGSSGSLVS